MRKASGWVLGAVMLWAMPASAASFALGADVDALYFWESNKTGVGINVYPGMDGGGGLVGELQLGYNIARTDTVSAVYPIFIGMRYDFADLIESNSWHPIVAAHAGLSVMQIHTPIANSGGSAGSDVPVSTTAHSDGGLGTNVAVGLNWSDDNDRAIGIVAMHNWATAQDNVSVAWVSLGVTARLVF